MYPQLALPAGTLFGRASQGTGALGSITVGANLQLTAGTLSAAAAPFNIAALAPANSPSSADRIAIEQAGSNVAVSYAEFMAGIAAVPNVPASTMIAIATGGSAARSVADIFADAVAVEAFGAVGDGRTDDTAALTTAMAAGRPLRMVRRLMSSTGNGQCSAASSH